MSEMNQNEIVPAETEEDYPVEYVDGRVYDEREEQRKDKIVDSLHKVTETVKTEAAIAKKRRTQVRMRRRRILIRKTPILRPS